MAFVVENLRTHCLEDASNGTADIAVAHDAHLFTIDICAHTITKRTLSTRALATHGVVPNRNPSGESQEQGHRQLCRWLYHCLRGIAHSDSFAIGIRHIDIIKAHSVIGDQLQVGEIVNHLLSHGNGKFTP